MLTYQQAQAEIVSILAHPERWALLWPGGNRGVVWVGFNPRPPRKVGATGILRGWSVEFAVFQSSPTPKGGRYESTIGASRRVREFQSSPTPKGGRYLRGGSHWAN